MRCAGTLVLLACAGCASIVGEPIESPPVPTRPAATPAMPPQAVAPAPEAPKPRRGRMRGDTRPDSYVVERGDTLFGIALDFGFDYRELAAWNGLSDPSRILVGQRLRLLPPDAPEEPLLKPLAGGPAGEAQSLPTQGSPVAPGALAAEGTIPAEVPTPAADKLPTLSEPRAVTLPWSDKALAQLGGESAAAKPASTERKPDARAGTRPEAKPDASPDVKSDSRDAKQDPRRGQRPDSRAEDTGKAAPAPPPAVPVPPQAVSAPPQAAPAPPRPAEPASPEDEWTWPARGSLAYRFGDGGALKGLGIAGKAGSPVLAAASGRVVYSGAGLRGYGKLVIIKHGEEYLTVYAHNRALLVKEGEQVRRGQRIAEMGDTDTDRVVLHFELRRFGKPVDPLSALPGERPPS